MKGHASVVIPLVDRNGERGCRRWGYGWVPGSCHRKSVGAGRCPRIAGATSGAAAASASPATSREATKRNKQDQDAKHRLPATTPSRNAQEHQ
jgi:hypothetical protein